MLKYLNNQNKIVILSTGMATLKEIAFSLSKLKSIKKSFYCIV